MDCERQMSLEELIQDVEYQFSSTAIAWSLPLLVVSLPLVYFEHYVTMAHHRQKVKMQYSVLGVSNEKTIFFISYSFRQ